MILKMKNPETGEWENIITLQGDKGDSGKDFEPVLSSALPASGTALTADTIYTASTITDYAFVHPASGWAHGTFATGDTATVTFSGKFVSSAPNIEANKTYEFDVLNGVWAVQEVVSE